MEHVIILIMDTPDYIQAAAAAEQVGQVEVAAVVVEVVVEMAKQEVYVQMVS